ncbi:hypothetical protein TNIN_188701 [Trichonephila inaurata madagascariensis]|uniref:Uncharacterized protein n=1 Tax=Trichonephila inaurata madagascariensis TaxID=2747483 RepID=A0A8X6XVL2_9ARAC|nr:hypothetical protein TNIN_188701 [Trichonephila inaurata madagascariensis]
MILNQMRKKGSPECKELCEVLPSENNFPHWKYQWKSWWILKTWGVLYVVEQGKVKRSKILSDANQFKSMNLDRIPLLRNIPNKRFPSNIMDVGDQK